MTFSTHLRIVFVSALLLVTAGLRAHDITLFPSTNGKTVTVDARYGHPGDYSQATLNKMLDFVAFAPGGERTDYTGQAKLEGINIRIAPATNADGVWVFATRYDNGFYVKAPDGRMVATTRRDMPAAATSTHNMKFGKALARVGASGPGFDRKVGHRLELVPQADPFALRAGDKVPVLVLLEGKPLAGVGVEIGDGETARKEADIPRYRTNAKGVAMVPIAKAGLQVIGVDRKVASPYPQAAAEDSYTATLAFMLGE